MRDINYIQTDKWTFDCFKLILQKPSGDKTNEDRYYGLQLNHSDEDIIWLNRETGDKIDHMLNNNHIYPEQIKEDSIYDFNCTCAEGTPSYERHGEGRCDGCHGKIFK